MKVLDKIHRVKADEIAARLLELSEEERALRALLRSARAKERAEKTKAEIQAREKSR